MAVSRRAEPTPRPLMKVEKQRGISATFPGQSDYAGHTINLSTRRATALLLDTVY
jgi:hypothetical protein